MKEKVLIIEDDEKARNSLSRVVTKEGFEVLLAEDGKQGLEIFKKELPEIVITDLKMPEIDGLEVMHTVRRILPNTQVILITGYGDYDTAIAALREGALDYLKKPIDLDQLIIALGRAREKTLELKKMPFYPTILLMEDEETTRTRLGRVLEKENWKVFLASDGEEGVKIFSENKIDIALIDIKMPKKDGLRVLHELRGMTNDFEAIILTGYGDESAAIQAMRDGAINFLRKPIDLDQLIVAVRRALDKLVAERALKYRIRELELAREIIAKITTEREVVVDIRDHTKKPARDFATRLLNSIPVGILVIDRSLKVIYVNEQISRVIDYEPSVVDQELINGLARIGITDLNLEALRNTIIGLFESKEHEIETITLGKYAYITMTKMTILGEEGKQEVMLVITRGERLQK